MRQEHELVPPERDRVEALIGRLEGQDAAVEAAVEQLGGHLARRHAPDFDERLRMILREPFDEGQQRMDGRLVRADHDAPATDLLELPDRLLGVRREPHQPHGVVLEQPPRFGQRARPGGPVEETLPELFFKAANALADRRLGAVQLLRRRREAPLRRDREECAEVLELHRSEGSKPWYNHTLS